MKDFVIVKPGDMGIACSHEAMEILNVGLFVGKEQYRFGS